MNGGEKAASRTVGLSQVLFPGAGADMHVQGLLVQGCSWDYHLRGGGWAEGELSRGGVARRPQWILLGRGTLALQVTGLCAAT